MAQGPSHIDLLGSLASRSFLMKLVAGVVLLLVNIVGLAGYSLYRSRQQYESRIAVATQNLAQSLNLTLTGIIDRSSVLVFAVKKEMERQLRTGRIERATIQHYILEHKARLPELDGLRVADALGNIVYGDGVAADSRAYLGDRDYFAELRRAPGAGMIVTKPIFGLISRKWVVEIVSRIDNPDGSFAGVAYAAVSLDYLSRIMATLDVGRQGVLNLRDRDLTVVVRHPDLPGRNSIGSKAVSPEMKVLVAQGHIKGTYRSHGSIDTVERVASFQKLGPHPFYIIAGLSHREFLAPWRAEVKDTVLLSCILVVILVLGTWLLYRNHLRERVSELKLSQYQEHLEQTVQQRTAELELRNEQLAGEIALRRQVEAELEKAAIIMQKMSDTVVWISSDARILYANDAACTLHGYSREELCSMSILELYQMSPEQWHEHWQELRREKTLHIEGVSRDAGGRYFPLEVTANFLCIDGVEFNCAICRDVTERREAEEEKQLLMQQLFQAQKIESVGRLAGGIAHDFNNLLTPILGYAEMLKMDLPPEGNEYRRVELITKAGDKAKVLIRQLLGFGRQQVLEMKTVDVNEVVGSFYEIMRRTIRENIELRLSLCDQVYGVLADANQLEQILMNLAVNAQDAIEDKGLIRLETAAVTLDQEYARQHAEVTPGQYLMLAMSDTGCGMDDEVLSHVFEPFFTTKGIGKGTGLGLATIYGLVKQHNGHVQVESAPGKGTTFKVYLPITEGMPVSEVALATPPPRQQLRDSRLLLVEDSDMVRGMIADLLINSGYYTLVTESPVQALKLAYQHDIDLLITDVVMPEMSGPELYQELRKIRPGVKVLYMSGYTFNVVLDQDHVGQDVHFLQKPFAVGDLTGMIDNILSEPA
jgi:two-component system, cell cycle sensor histidine kinase and response regulator CckA